MAQGPSSGHVRAIAPRNSQKLWLLWKKCTRSVEMGEELTKPLPAVELWLLKDAGVSRLSQLL